ncbi:hypothetical protein Tco_0202726, partial [Tanacetum coccineum]
MNLLTQIMNAQTGAQKPENLKQEDVGGMIRKDILKEEGSQNPRYVGPFKVLKQVGFIAYKLELPRELSRVHNTFHELVEIMDHEVKRLKRSRISLVKVQWNSKRGPEFTWECKDQFQKKFPHLFAKTAPST